MGGSPWEVTYDKRGATHRAERARIFAGQNDPGRWVGTTLTRPFALLRATLSRKRERGPRFSVVSARRRRRRPLRRWLLSLRRRLMRVLSARAHAVRIAARRLM